MVDETENLSEQDKAEIARALGYGQNFGDVKQNAHTFLADVAKANDTLKLGNLIEPEIGSAENPVRAWQFLKVFASDIMDNKPLGEYFAKRSEIITASSLSRYALLVKLAVTQTRQLADISPEPKKENKSWFKSKDKSSEQTEMQPTA